MPAEQKLVEQLGIPVQTEQCEVNGYRLNYVRAGSGPPVILLHGLNIGWGQWCPAIPKLANQWNVYALDLPGAGKSVAVDFLNCDIHTTFVNTVRGWINNLDPGPIRIIGHSFGAWIALSIALERDVQIEKLILVDPVGLSEHMPLQYRLLALRPVAKFLSHVVKRPTFSNMQQILTGPLYKKEKVTPAFVDYVLESVLQEPEVRHPFLLIHRLSGLLKMKRELLLVDRLPSLRTPTLVIVGEKDPLIPSADLKKQLSNMSGIELCVIKEAGHVPLLEQPEDFLVSINEFLRK